MPPKALFVEFSVELTLFAVAAVRVTPQEFPRVAQ
jgi:hypothetical protein